MKKLFVFVITLLLLTSCSQVSKSANSVVSSIEEEEYDKASITLKEIRKNDEFDKDQLTKIETKINEKLTKELDKKVEDFEKGKIKTQTIENLLKGIEDLDIKSLNEKVNKIENNLNDLIFSRDSFEKGETFYKNKRYEQAITQLQKVSKKDAKFKEAKEIIKDSKSLLLEKTLKKASKLADNQQLKEAFETLKDVEDFYKENKNYQKKLNDYKTLLSDQYIQKAETFAKQNDFKQATVTLNEISKYFDNDSELQNKLNEYKSQAIAQDKRRLNDLLKQVTYMYDDISDTTSIVPEGISTDSVDILEGQVSFYPKITFTGKEIQSTDNLANLFLIVGFSQDDWIFFDRIDLKIDDKRLSWDVPFGDKYTEVGWGSIYEWTFRVSLVHTDLIDNLTEIVNSKSTKIRFSGQGFRDYTITDYEKSTLKLFLEIYSIYKNIELDSSI